MEIASRSFSCVAFLLAVLFASPAAASQEHSGAPAWEPPYPVLWRTEVGRTTFRTTMAFARGRVVIGTHGKSLDGLDEPSDGVYLLLPATGEIERVLHAPGHGDLDVGGIAVFGDTIYFTTDNSFVVAMGFDGTPRWRARMRGKVRPAPALGLFNGDAVPDVVAGDEEGQLVAFDGVTGHKLWSHLSGDNDFGSHGYIAAPAIEDLDGDGRDDVLVGARDGILGAYSGADGHVLWEAHPDFGGCGPTGIHASPSLVDLDRDGRPEVVAAWSYGNLMVLDARTGATRWNELLFQMEEGGIEGLFASPIPLPGDEETPGVFLEGTSWWGSEDGILGVGPSGRLFKRREGRTSATAIVSDLDGDGLPEAILGAEAGQLIAVHADGTESRIALSRNGTIEAAAMLADLDGDGTQELLVASNDGFLTCFSTGSTATPLVSRFRGTSSLNQGRLGSLYLGDTWARALRPLPPARGF